LESPHRELPVHEIPKDLSRSKNSRIGTTSDFGVKIHGLPVTKILIQPQRRGCMEVKLAPSACSHRWGFRRTCGLNSWGSSEGPKELIQFCRFEED
jgi:hypothetical protein